MIVLCLVLQVPGQSVAVRYCQGGRSVEDCPEEELVVGRQLQAIASSPYEARRDSAMLDATIIEVGLLLQSFLLLPSFMLKCLVRLCWTHPSEKQLSFSFRPSSLSFGASYVAVLGATIIGTGTPPSSLNSFAMGVSECSSFSVTPDLLLKQVVSTAVWQ